MSAVLACDARAVRYFIETSWAIILNVLRRAASFRQARNGVYIRMALLQMVLEA